MLRLVLSLLLIQISTILYAQEILHLRVDSQNLDSNRDIWIFLPTDYDSTFSYPVLYMHDGQNLYWDSLAFAGTWNMESQLSKLNKENINLIIVAIANGGEKRMEELSWFINKKYPSGKGNKYLAFIVEELMPLINTAYNIDQENVGIMGSSLGGLISLQAMAAYPDIFKKGAIFSPALWFNPETMDKAFLSTINFNSKIYMISGAKEVMGNINFPKDQMKTQLILSDIISSNNIYTEIHPDGEHKEWYWAREFMGAVEFLFNGD